MHWPADLAVPTTCTSTTVGCSDSTYTFDKMGVLKGNEINNVDSGEGDGTYGSVGRYTYDDTAADYYKIEITIPSFDAAGSYGFSIQFVNGISSVKFGTMDVSDDNNMKPYTEIIQLLDPGPVGTGEWVQVVVPKWDFLWVIKSSNYRL